MQKYSKKERQSYAIEQSEKLSKKLESSLEALYNGENYKDWLNTASKFHTYSLNNQILIMMQRPDASNVASFSKWKEMERNVNKGAKGIRIFAPMFFKTKLETPEMDENSQPKLDENGQVITKSKEVEYTRFKAVTVFDISDTAGKPLPTLGVDELKGDVDKYPLIKEAIEKISPVPISYENVLGGAKGYFSAANQQIVVQQGMDELATIKTLAHEISHSLLHDKENGTLIEGLDETNTKRNIKEVQAESCAYILCNHLGLDTSDYSIGYIAGWENKPSMEDFKKSLDTIRTTSAKLIDETDKNLMELSKDILIEKYKDLNINYHIDECMEFPILGNSFEFNNIDDALDKYKTMPDTNNIKDLVIDIENEDLFLSIPILMNNSYNPNIEEEHSELLYNPTIKDIVDKSKALSEELTKQKELGKEEITERKEITKEKDNVDFELLGEKKKEEEHTEEKEQEPEKQKYKTKHKR